MKHKIVIVGAGNWMCGDDAVGIVVATLLARRFGDRARVGFDLSLLWEVVDGACSPRVLVLVDSMSADNSATAGTLRAMGYPRDADSLPSLELRNTPSLDLRSILSLSQERGTLPTTTRVYGVAGERFALGDALSPPVSKALGGIEERIADDIRCNSAPLRRFDFDEVERVTDSSDTRERGAHAANTSATTASPVTV